MLQKAEKFTVKKFRSRELQKVAGMRFTKATGATNVDAFEIRFFYVCDCQCAMGNN